jgi:hypothetical protein
MATEVGELYCVALAVVEPADRFADVLGLGEVPDLPLEVVAALGSEARIALFASTPRGLGADHVNAETVDLGEEIGAQRTAAGVETIWLVPKPEKHFLEYLFGEGVVVENPACQPERSVRMALVHLGEGLVVETPDRD